VFGRHPAACKWSARNHRTEVLRFAQVGLGPRMLLRAAPDALPWDNPRAGGRTPCPRRAADAHIGNRSSMQSTSAELARSALDAAPDAMIILDGAGVVQYANRQASTLFGYSHEELIGKAVELLMPERFRGRHAGHRRAYFNEPRMRPMGANFALFGQRRDGGEFPVEISLSPIYDHDRTLVAAAIRDVSDRKQAEAELRRAQEASERARQAADHLREVADEARESANRANEAKGRFLATASHDLRQPLQSLALLNGALRRMVTNPEATEVVSQQEQAIGAMSRLLNALLDISKLESGAVRPEISHFKVGMLLDRLRREFASLAASKGLDLQVQATDDSVHSDPSLVEQILKNLVSNALKYTRRGRILLRSRAEDATVRIDVQDTGIGIPPDQIAYIYDEFYQVGVPANSSRDGYGLGLSIVQRLVKLLNLRLEVTSEVGAGSVFSLILPVGSSLEDTDRQGTSHPVQRSAPEETYHILLVEDDAGVRDATRLLLKVEGYRVTAVSSLSEAMDSGQERVPDLLVSDYHLKNGELGTHVINAVRARWGGSLKAVLITGDTSAAIKELSGDPLLRIASKPVDAEQLLALLGELLSD
jgi:two-component system, sensor histidine kinase